MRLDEPPEPRARQRLLVPDAAQLEQPMAQPVRLRLLLLVNRPRLTARIETGRRGFLGGPSRQGRRGLKSPTPPRNVSHEVVQRSKKGSFNAAARAFPHGGGH